MEAPSPEFLAEDDSAGVFVVAIVTTALAAVSIGLRFTTRFVAESKLWLDDWTIIVAMAFEAALTAFIIYSERHLNLGRHVQTLSPDQAMGFAKNMLIVQELYFAAQAMVKVSLVSLYYRIFGVSNKFRITSFVAGGIVVAWWISCIFPIIFACIPVEAFWDQSITEKRCINQRAFGTANGTFNMLTDIMVLTLPLPMVWSLQFNLRKKLLVSGAFLVGAFVCVISVVRLSCFPGFDIQDPTFGAAKIYLWTNVESCSAIIAACLPTLGPLFIGFIGKQVSRIAKSSGSGNPTTDSERSTKHNRSQSGKKGTTTSAASASAPGKFYRLNEDVVPLRPDSTWADGANGQDSHMKVSVQAHSPGSREEYPMGVLKQTTFDRQDSRW